MTPDHRVLRAAASVALAASLTTISACAPHPETTVTQPGTSEQSAEDTSTLTPLERGQLRTALLKDVRAAIDAWKASDPDAMRDYMADELVKKFEATWAGYSTDGMKIEHVHDVKYLDVIQLNKESTQALVTYRYDDSSYLVDSATGQKTGDLEKFSEKEMQLTLDKQDDGGWMIVRIIAADNAYR